MYLKRVTSIFSIIMIFMFTIGQSLLPIVANAQELNTAGLVDSFKIDKTDLFIGQQTKVTVNFSEKDGLKLKSGDTLTLTLPPELKGLDTEFLLNDYGTCKVTAGTVVCTFNDKVSTHENIEGYLNFFVEAANVGTDEKKEIETNFGTNVDKQSVTITGPTSGGGTDPGKGPFFYKTGDMRGKPGEVRWFLNVNLNKEELSRDIVVTDNLQEGQTLNKDSFYISIDDNLGRRSLTLQEFEKQGYGTIAFNDDNSFKVVLNKDKARLAAFTIGYTSTITEAGKKQDSFKNDYTIDYQVPNEELVIESGTHPVENMTAGGGATGNKVPKGKLKIVKHIEGNKGKVIPNVSFKLYKESGEQVGDEYKTNEKGIVETPQLSPGKYYVQEVSAPDYIDFDPQKKVAFEIKSDDENGVELDIPNKVKTTSVSGTKMWEGDNEKDRPSSIKVDLLQNEKIVDTKEVTAADGWKYKFDNLAVYDANGVAYKYEVKEQPVDGYQTEVKGYDITNTKVVQTTKVEGTKTWKGDNGEDRPSSIKVDLLQNDKVVDTKEVTAETDWKYEFKELAAYDAEGKVYEYKVKEQPVAGYESKVEGYDITNTKVGKISVSGTKKWNDNNAKDRPTTIKIDLLQNDKVVDTKEVTAETDWKYEFKELAAYDAEGKAYEYKVKEQPVAGYESKVEGYDITNTKVGKISVSGTKKWEDYNNKFNTRPGSITVQLLQNGAEFQTKEVKADEKGNWTFSFKDLPKYDEQGNEFKYTVSEVKVDRYETKVEGTTITNTYKNTDKTEVSGKKVWEDYNNKFNTRPEGITVQLLQNGAEFQTKEVKADEKGNWTFSFKDLPKYDEQGNEFKYTVSEVKVDRYETKVEGTTITNTYKNTETTEVSGKKIWEDYNNKFNTRPGSITVQLLQNDKVLQDVKVEADKEGNWNFNFKDLPKYDGQGNEFKYTVSEVKVDGYETKVEGTTITNTYKNTETTEVSGKKVWEDYNNKFNTRPEGITVQLLQNGAEFQTKEVKADEKGNWTFSFKDLPKYDEQGNEFKYTVSEVKVDRYETKVEGTTITNTYKNTETTEVSGKKIWEDYNNKFNTRPGSITVQLLQNDKVLQDVKVEADKEGNWNFNFKDLPKYDEQGNEFKYTVSEVKVDRYETKVEGTTITNTYKNTETTEVSGKKVWEDYNNKFNTRPEGITVQLLQNGAEFQTKEVKADEKGNWTFSFKDLPKYDEQGNEFKYTVSEVKVDRYETKVEGTTITNTYKNTETTEVSGKKIWEDYNNKFNTRPGSITVQLLQNDKVLQDVKVEADKEGNWNFNFKDLPKYDEQGNEFKYTVSEVKVDRYETKVEGTTITNTYKSTETTEVSGKKVWEDYNNKFNTRPEGITVQLLQNGAEFQTKEVKADEKGNWTFSFKDLPKYDEQGNEFKYTVSEVKVDRYETKVEGTTITNTYKNTETTEVSGKKIWEDYNNKFNTRPGSITVQLLQNDKVLQDVKVEADKEGNWNFNFKDLPKYDEQGNEFKYTVSEVKVDRYETKVEGTTITNTYKSTETTEVSGKKVWEDYNNKFNTRPEGITVQLLQNGAEFQTKEVKADEKGNWTFSFKDLPKYDGQGNEFKYTVSEVKVDRYETKVEGTTITNTYKNTETTEISGKKVWDDNNAIDRPISIKVDLLQNGKVIDTKEVSVATNWKYTFEKLQVYDANGVAYKYEVKEQPVAGYKSEVNGYDITNTKIKDESGVDPKDPSTDPKDPSTDPKDPSTDPKDPSTDPKDPSTDPKDPSTDPKDPSTDPKDPSTDPKDPGTVPNTNTDKNSDSKVPPTTENDKPTLLPNTGGTSAEMSSILGGMVLFLLGGILLARQRIK
ncbi:Cna B-type domain-containing protein [Bacillus sp. R86525]|uniref:Cna B-type domain-containing protein n=1 Tax=Bacillus sp. R86525 TaxID=3101709 RepID=UPI00366FF1CE